MAGKLILFVLLAGFIHLPTIFSRELSDEEIEKIRIKFYTKCYPQCKHLMSDETYQMVLDGAEIDNEETRAYTLCTFLEMGYIVDLKLIGAKIIKDLPFYIDRSLSPTESVTVDLFIKICEKEVVSCTTGMDIMLTFIKCFAERFQSDM